MLRPPGHGLDVRNSGALVATYYSAANCSGTLQGTRYYCSAGSSNNYCTVTAQYQYGGAELNAMFTAMHSSSIEGVRVAYYDTTCPSSGSDCGAYFYLYGN